MQADTTRVQAGWRVIDRDGEEIGTVEEIGTGFVLVQKGLIFTRDIYIPTEEITHVDTETGHAHVDVTKAEIDGMGWDEPPVVTGTEQLEDGGYAAGYASTMDDTTGRSDLGEGDTLRVPIREEQLQATKTRQQAGEVQVRRDVVEEQREIDVPVTQERVEVRRVPADRAATGNEQIATDGETIRVPVTAESVEVTRQPRVVEEVEIRKRPETTTQRVSETVRREEVDVEESGNVLAGSASAATGAGDTLSDGSLGVRREGYGDEDTLEGDERLR